MKALFTTRRRVLATTTIAVAAIAGVSAVRSSHASANAVPTAEVRRGDFVEYIQVRGEIKASDSKTLVAPAAAGDLQILKLAHTGTQVKKCDIVLQFDSTKLQRTLEQKQSDLASAEAEIRQQQATEHMTEEQNLTDSLSAKFNVESARLDVSKAEILSQIDGEKNKLALADSQQKLLESQTKLDSGKLGSAADVEMKKKKRDKARFDVETAERQIASMTVRAPSDGVVTVLSNDRASNFGGNAPDFREGDRAWPGAAILEIPNLSSIRMVAHVDEADRGKLNTGQASTVHIDAVPDTDFSGHVEDISRLAKLDWNGWPPIKDFDLSVAIDRTDPRIRPGMKANTRIQVNSIPNSVLVPVGAVFQHNGRTVVYVSEGSNFEERNVQLGRRSGDTAQVIAGVRPGERVALKDLAQEKGGAGQ